MKKQEQFRQNRDSFNLEIRKENREQIFLKKRRNVTLDATMEQERPSSSCPPIIVDEKFEVLVKELEKNKFDVTQIDDLCNDLDVQDDNTRHKAAIGLRKLLSQDEGEPFVQRIIDNGAVPKLINLMKDRKYPQLQLQSCWIITNIAFGSSSQCDSIVSKNGIEAIMQLLYENTGCILEQALWGFGNIAGDCLKCRDSIIMKGGVECILRILQYTESSNVLQLGCWALSNLCRGQTAPKYELIKGCLPVIASCIVKGVLTNQYLSSCLWALAIHSEGSKAKIRVLLKTQSIVSKLIDICYSKQNELVVPTLRVIGNISTGSEQQTNQLLNNHVLALLRRLLDHQKRSIRRQACWTLSNICAGTLKQVQKCIFFPDLINKLMQMLLVDENDVRVEICYILGNMCHLGDPSEIMEVITGYHVLPGLAILLQQDQNTIILEAALHCLYQLLSIGAKFEQKNVVLAELQRIPGLFDRLQNLQYHTSPSVYKHLVKIFQRYFTLEENPF